MFYVYMKTQEKYCRGETGEAKKLIDKSSGVK
jgi:hypothetical protein